MEPILEPVPKCTLNWKWNPLFKCFCTTGKKKPQSHLYLGQRPSATWQQANPLFVVNPSGFFFLWPSSEVIRKHIMSYSKAAVPTNWLPVCDSLSPSQGQQSREYHLLHHALSILMFSNKINIQSHAYYFPTELMRKHPLNPQRQHWLQIEGNIFLSHIDSKGVDRAQRNFSVISNKEHAAWHKSWYFCQS